MKKSSPEATPPVIQEADNLIKELQTAINNQHLMNEQIANFADIAKLPDPKDEDNSDDDDSGE